MSICSLKKTSACCHLFFWIRHSNQWKRKRGLCGGERKDLDIQYVMLMVGFPFTAQIPCGSSAISPNPPQILAKWLWLGYRPLWRIGLLEAQNPCKRDNSCLVGLFVCLFMTWLDVFINSKYRIIFIKKNAEKKWSWTILKKRNIWLE